MSNQENKTYNNSNNINESKKGGLRGYFQGEAKKMLNTDGLKQNNEYLKELAGSIKKPEESENKETFENACFRLEMTKEDLLTRYNALRNESIFFACSTFLSFMLMLYWFYTHNFFGVISSFGVVLILFSFLFQRAFRAYQIRMGKLLTPHEWLKDGFSELWPYKIKRLRYSNRNLRKILKRNKKLHERIQAINEKYGTDYKVNIKEKDDDKKNKKNKKNKKQNNEQNDTINDGINNDINDGKSVDDQGNVIDISHHKTKNKKSNNGLGNITNQLSDSFLSGIFEMFTGLKMSQKIFLVLFCISLAYFLIKGVLM